MCVSFSPFVVIALPISDSQTDNQENQIGQVEEHLSEVFGHLNRIPAYRRARTRDALLHAFHAGECMARLKMKPEQPPMGIDGAVNIGPELKQHILRMRNVYRRIDDLTEIVQQLLAA